MIDLIRSMGITISFELKCKNCKKKKIHNILFIALSFREPEIVALPYVRSFFLPYLPTILPLPQEKANHAVISRCDETPLFFFFGKSLTLLQVVMSFLYFFF